MKKILSCGFIARVRVVLRRIVFGSDFQRFDKSGGGHLKGRLNNCYQSATVLLKTTLTRMIRLQDHTSARVTDIVSKIMNSGTFKAFI